MRQNWLDGAASSHRIALACGRVAPVIKANALRLYCPDQLW